MWLALGLLATAGFAALLYPHTALPITWDELLYMSIAYEPRPEPWVLNRYFHIGALAVAMAIVPDPFDAARWWWCVNAGLILAATFALLRAVPAGCRPAAATVLAFLVYTRNVFAEYLGIPYADYSAALMMTLSVALVAGPVFAGREVPGPVALLLGVLLVLGFRSKETAIVLLWLAPLGVLRPGGRLRLDGARRAFLSRYILGVLTGLAIMAACEAWLVGDPLFGLRPASWQALLAFNAGATEPGEHSWLTWMLRPLAFATPVLYLAAGVWLAAGNRDLRQVLLFSLPVAYLLLLTLVGLGATATVNARTTLPILPVMAGLTCVVLFRCITATAASFPARMAASYALASAAVVGIWYTWSHWRDPPALLFQQQLIESTLIPLIVFVAVLGTLFALAGPRRLRLPLTLLAMLTLGIGMLPAGFQSVRALRWRALPIRAENRFAGLRQLAAHIRPGPDGRMLVDQRIYDGKLAERGRWALAAYVQMSARTHYDRASLDFVSDVTAMAPADLRVGDVVIAPPEHLARLAAAMPAEATAPAADAAPGWQLTHAGDGRVAALHVPPWTTRRRP